jgi:hypothetical protein
LIRKQDDSTEKRDPSDRYEYTAIEILRERVAFLFSFFCSGLKVGKTFNSELGAKTASFVPLVPSRLSRTCLGKSIALRTQ